MTINAIASTLAKLEGKKSQARIGDLREILGIISDLIYADYLANKDSSPVLDALANNGMKRAKKKAPKKGKKNATIK